MRLCIVLFAILLSLPSWAQAAASAEPEPETASATLTVGGFSEFSRDAFFRYNLVYTTVDAGEFQAQWQRFDNPDNYQRLFLHYGRLPLVDTDSVVWTVQPGIGFSNRNDLFLAANSELTIVPARIRILARGYKGNTYDQAYILSAFQPVEEVPEFVVMHYINLQTNVPSTSYVGPAANLWDGKAFVWIGKSLTPNATWAASVQFRLDF